MDLISALPEDVFDEVVEFLSPADILKATLVSRGWSQMFGQSTKCMQKVTVKFCFANRNNDLNPLLKSDRKYQNLTIGFSYKPLQDSEPKIRAILKKFSKSIVNLHTSHDFQRICELPKLKQLKFWNSRYRDFRDRKLLYYFCSKGLLVMCPNISRLKIFTAVDLIGRCLTNVQEAIKNMQNLESLEIPQIDFFDNFPQTDCKFKLKELKIPTIRTKTIYDLLKHHQSSLKCLKFSFLNLEDIAFILSDLPNLHTLQMEHLSDYTSENVELPENSTVKNVFIVDPIYYHPNIAKIARLFTKLKNLQQLRLDILYSRFIPELFACKSLTLVKYRQLCDLVTEDQKDNMNNNEHIKFVQIPLDAKF